MRKLLLAFSYSIIFSLSVAAWQAETKPYEEMSLEELRAVDDDRLSSTDKRLFKKALKAAEKAEKKRIAAEKKAERARIRAEKRRLWEEEKRREKEARRIAKLNKSTIKQLEFA